MIAAVREQAMIEDEYEARLKKAVDAWGIKNPMRYGELKEQAIAGLAMPIRFRKRDELGPIMQKVLDTAVLEAVRRENKWPDIHQWLGLQRKKPPSGT